MKAHERLRRGLVVDDAGYFSRRASEEREAAMKAANPNARQAHLDLATRYEDLAQSITAREQYLGLRLVRGSLAS